MKTDAKAGKIFDTVKPLGKFFFQQVHFFQQCSERGHIRHHQTRSDLSKVTPKLNGTKTKTATVPMLFAVLS